MTKLPVSSSEKTSAPSEKVVKQIERARLQSSQSSQTAPSQPTNSSKPQSSTATPASSNSSSENKKSKKKKKDKHKQKSKTSEKMETGSESDNAAWGDPMEALFSDRERCKSRSPGRRQDRTKISPIRLQH